MLAYVAAPANRASLEPRNRLLVALPPEDLRRLRPHLKPVTLPQRKVLFEPDEPLTRISLIEAGVVSLLTVFENGTTVEMASVGREGLVGVGALLGGGITALLILIFVAALSAPLDPSTRTLTTEPPLDARHAEDVEADRAAMHEACER